MDSGAAAGCPPGSPEARKREVRPDEADHCGCQAGQARRRHARAIEAGARGLTATDVRGFGQEYGHLKPAVRRVEQKALMLPKLRIDIIVPDEIGEFVVGAIAKSVNAGAIGDGKIWVTAVDSVLRVRTGERDRDAV
jgi:nitrogen regulatory protein P-II 1